MATLTIKRNNAERLKAVEVTFLTFVTGLRFMAKKDMNDPDSKAVIDKSVGSGITITVAGSGSSAAEAQITINPADTNALPNKETTLSHELRDGASHSLDSGNLIVQPEVILS